MALKYRFNLKDIKLEDFKVYLLAMFKGILPKKKIKNFLDLEQFIQKKSAWVTQVTLYNYLKQEWAPNMFYILIMTSLLIQLT